MNRVYRASAAFPSHEIYGLTSQIRRAADLGAEQYSPKEPDELPRRIYPIGSDTLDGSLLELETQLIVQRQRLGYARLAKKSITYGSSPD